MIGRTYQTAAGSLVALATLCSDAHAQNMSIDSVAALVHAAYVTADIDALGVWFDDTIAFDGEIQVIAAAVEVPGALGGHFTPHDSTAVMRPTEVLSPGWAAATLSRRSLADSYRRLVANIGHERFTGLLATRPWKLIRSDRDRYPYSQVRSGDHVLLLHLRGDRADTVLDEAVMFVLREVAGEYRVVAHLADY